MKNAIHHHKQGNAFMSFGKKVTKCSCGFNHPVDGQGDVDTQHCVDKDGNTRPLNELNGKLYLTIPKPYEYSG